MFSEFIRTFTNRQGELRYGQAFTAVEMQEASNQVAINTLTNILKPQNNGLLPSLGDIAADDATGVGDRLFYLDSTDSASPTKQNSAWSGTILFSMLGSDQTGKLLGGDCEFNTLNDLRDVLFAYDAFMTAYDAVSLWDGLTNNTDDVSVLINTWFNNMFFANPASGESVLESVTSNQTAGTAFDFIRKHGRYEMLDELRKVVLGIEYLASDATTGINFQQRAYLLFDTAESLGLLDGLNVSLNNVGINQVKVDFGSFLSIYHLTPFALFIGDTAAEAGLAHIHDQVYTQWHEDKGLTSLQVANGEANFSEKWLIDRTEMFAWKLKYDEANKLYSSEFNTSTVEGNWDYVDMSIKIGGAPLTLAIDGTGISLYDHQIVFGSKQNDIFNGSGDTDRLYGMAGDDLINGDDGDDYIEGNLGNDTLLGGDNADKVYGGMGSDTLYGDDNELADSLIGGNDTLYGGTGNDHLYGEADNDTLYGGYGDDKLHGGTGADHLDGGLGADTLQGGANDDTYFVDNTGDLITELANEGTDLVQSSISYTLTANVEHLTLIGNSGNNRLEGGAGNDPHWQLVA